MLNLLFFSIWICNQDVEAQGRPNLISAPMLSPSCIAKFKIKKGKGHKFVDIGEPHPKFEKKIAGNVASLWIGERFQYSKPSPC